MEWKTLLSKNHFVETEHEGGTAYRNDYDTIICSTLFRRLQDKAQVFPLDDDDYVRTRLTHSLEVSAIGKKLGEYAFAKVKECKQDQWFEEHSEKELSEVLLCAGLVHDIGNPPFGHFGEYAIREWFQSNLEGLTLGDQKVTEILSNWQLQDLYTFEGNAQSIRLLSKTPYLGKENGFNLSYSVLGTIIKYPISSENLKNSNPNRYKKIGYNFSERELFEAVNRETGMNGCRHPLSYLLEAADDIAYRTSDLEDAMVKKVISFEQVMDTFERCLQNFEGDVQSRQEVRQCIYKLAEMFQEEVTKNTKKPGLAAVQRWNQHIQGMMIRDAGQAFVKNYSQIMQGGFQGDLFEDTVSDYIIKAVSDLSERKIYTSSVKTRRELFGRRVINSLLDQFMPAAIGYDTNGKNSYIDRRIMDTVSEFYKSMYRNQSAGKSEGEKLYLRILMITDYISGMTDNYAKRLYEELFA